jgi:hypothetical protein
MSKMGKMGKMSNRNAAPVMRAFPGCEFALPNTLILFILFIGRYPPADIGYTICSLTLLIYPLQED